MSELTLYLDFCLSLALGTNKAISNDILKAYDIRGEEYYECLKSQGSEEFLQTLTGSFQEEHLTRNCHSMILKERSEGLLAAEQKSSVFQLIKKGYKVCYNYYIESEGFDGDEFLQRLIKYRGGVELLSDRELFYNYVCTFWLFSNCNRQVSAKMGSYKDSFIETLGSTIKGNKVAASFKATWLKDTTMHDKLAEFWQVRRSKNLSVPLDKYMESFITAAASNLNPVLMALHKMDAFDASTFSLKNSLGRYYNLLILMCAMHDLDLPSLASNSSISKRELHMLLKSLDACIEEGILKQNEYSAFVIVYVSIKCLCENYVNLKKTYLSEIDKLKYESVSLLKKEQESLNRELDRSRSEYRAKIDQLKVAEVKIGQEMSRLTKENEMLRTELSKAENLRKEVASLRSLVYSMDDAESSIQEVTSESKEELAKLIDNKDVIVAAGHPNFINYLKEMFNEVRFVSKREETSNLKYLRGVKHVFFCANSTNHTFGYKIMEAIEGTDVNFHYMIPGSNLDKVIKHMYTCITHK